MRHFLFNYPRPPLYTVLVKFYKIYVRLITPESFNIRMLLILWKQFFAYTLLYVNRDKVIGLMFFFKFLQYFSVSYFMWKLCIRSNKMKLKWKRTGKGPSIKSEQVEQTNIGLSSRVSKNPGYQVDVCDFKSEMR